MAYIHNDHIFTRHGTLTGLVAYLVLSLIIAASFL